MRGIAKVLAKQKLHRKYPKGIFVSHVIQASTYVPSFYVETTNLKNGVVSKALESGGGGLAIMAISKRRDLFIAQLRAAGLHVETDS